MSPTRPYIPGADFAGAAHIDLTERAGRDGCDCPVQVTRCAHMEDLVIVLAVDALQPKAFLDAHPKTRHPFGVTTLRGQGIDCDCGCGGRGWRPRQVVTFNYRGDDEAEANAAFDAAEERLLRGEV